MWNGGRIAAVLVVLSLAMWGGPAGALTVPGAETDAQSYASRLREKSPPQPNVARRDAAIARAVSALEHGAADTAVAAYEEAITAGDDRPETWLALSEAWTKPPASDPKRALEAAYLAFEGADHARPVAGDAALRIARLLSGPLARPAQAITVYQESVKLFPARAEFAGELKSLNETIGLLLTNSEVDVEAEPPRVCLTFSGDLSRRREVRFEDFITIEPAFQAAVSVSGAKLCVAGVDFGRSYKLTAREGLPGQDGIALKRSVEISVAVGARKASVAFRNNGFILPKAMATGIPVTTVNVANVAVKVYRVGDRGLVREIARGRLLRAIDSYTGDEIRDDVGALLWEGSMTVAGQRNKPTTTIFPLPEVIKGAKPGIFVVTAAPTGDDAPASYFSLATQWVLLTDIGLETFQGSDGLTVFARSLQSAKPLAGQTVALIARNNDEIATATTDADGRAHFDKPLLGGSGGAAPMAAMIYGAEGDYAFLDITQAAFDLSDRGVGGRKTPGPLDAFLYTDRGVYRPGELVHLTTLLRDDQARAVDGVPLTLNVLKPNGTVFFKGVVPPTGGGGFVLPLALSPTAPHGTWTVEALVDPKAPAIGTLTFHVEDFIPEQLHVDLATDARLAEFGAALEASVTAKFLYGPPATGLSAAGEVLIEADPAPFPGLKDYRFGLVQESFSARRVAMQVPDTDANGATKASARLIDPPDTTLRLKATIEVGVNEPGGRATKARTSLPVAVRANLIGLRPRFSTDSDAGVEANASAEFDVVAVDALGTRLAAPKLKFAAFRERYNYSWFMRDGQPRFEVTTTDEPMASGDLAVTADAPATLSVKTEQGRYRVEVYDPATGAATSTRFYAGWWDSAPVADTPDKVEVVADKPSYAPGDIAHVHIKAPFAGEALITILGDKLFESRSLAVSAGDVTLDLPVKAEWTAGAYVTASIHRPLDSKRGRASARAIGLAWLAVDPAQRTLSVSVDTPERVTPRQTVAIPLTLSALAGGAPIEQAYVTLAAVDEGILQLTDFANPDPVKYYFGKRMLGVDLRDDFGRLLEAPAGPVGPIRQGGDANAASRLPVVPVRIVSLFQGPVRPDASGHVVIPVEMPDFAGSVRLMVVAWDSTRVGSGHANLIVRDPVIADASFPRFLAPGDEARVTLSVHNVEAPAGAFTLTAKGDNAAAIVETAPFQATLAAGERRVIPLTLKGVEAGIGHVTITIAGPNGLSIAHEWEIAVRSARPVESQYVARTLKPGESVETGAAALNGYLPGTRRLSIALTNGPRFDTEGLLGALERYPYGCLEQTVSTSYPFVASATPGSAADTRVTRVQNGITRVLDRQRYDGLFGLWHAHGPAQPWLSAYALEFLTRARAKGFGVPDAPYQDGLKALKAMTDANGEQEPAALASHAYGLYVLALAGQMTPGPLRYMHDTFLAKLPTPLSKAQLGAALARLGDQGRAKTAFAAALAQPQRDYWGADYGDQVRDAAAVAALLTEANMMTDKIPELIDRLPVNDTSAQRTSTQQQSWLILASQAIVKPGTKLDVTVNGAARAGNPVLLLPTPEELKTGLTVKNVGAGTVWQGVSSAGVPVQPQAAARNGFKLSRKFLNRDGSPVNLDKVRQNDGFIMLLEGESATKLDHQVLVSHGLPAGWEILGGAAALDPKGFPWLGELTTPVYAEARDDRYAAQVDLTADKADFRLAFQVRAVTPGKFELPGGEMVDMYRPRYFARHGTGMITVAPPG